jgi:endoglucanase
VGLEGVGELGYLGHGGVVVDPPLYISFVSDAWNHFCQVLRFSTQEEVGLRGALTAAYGVEPDIGVALDVTLAVNYPRLFPEDAVSQAGAGVAIKLFDSSMISTRWLVDQFVETAERHKIPYQLEVLPLGGTDGGAIQRSRAGVPSITLSLPTRYIHTIQEAVHRDDVKHQIELLTAWLEGR